QFGLRKSEGRMLRAQIISRGLKIEPWTAVIENYETANIKALQSKFALPVQPQPGDTVTVELVVIDHSLKLLINERLAASVLTDYMVADHPFFYVKSSESITIKSFETLNLDGLPEAEALKLAGTADK